MERMRRLVIAMVRKVMMMFLSPQHQGTVVDGCENDKGAGVLARRGGGGDEDGDGFCDCGHIENPRVSNPLDTI